MTRTRLSLFYLAGYLTVAGLALLLVPSFALDLLLSNGSYGDVFPRVAGMLLLGLAALVTQIIRHRIEVLYPTTLVIRLFFLVVFAYLFREHQRPVLPGRVRNRGAGRGLHGLQLPDRAPKRLALPSR